MSVLKIGNLIKNLTFKNICLYLFLGFIMVTLCAVALINYTKANAISNSNYVEGKVLVCVKGGEKTLTENAKRANAPMFSINESLITLSTNENLQQKYSTNTNQVNEILSTNQISDYIVNKDNEDTCEILSVDCDNTDSFIKTIEHVDGVLWAQPNYIYNTDNINDEFNKNLNNESFSNNKYQFSDNNKNDYYQYQWGLDKCKYSSENNTADIEAKAGQDAIIDPSKNVVAVVDSGLDYTNPDISIWSDGENISALTSLGGGKYGINTTDDGQGTDNPYDIDDGHGTHCAGAISAIRTEENFNISGVSKNTQIMACRALASGSGSTINIIKCYKYIFAAKQNGINVVCTSNSWGNSSNTILYDYAISNIITESAKLGIATCFSAGNSRIDLDNSPNLKFFNPFALVVGASNDTGRSALFSNFGQRTVDVFAPGVDMLNYTTTSKDTRYSSDISNQYISCLDDNDGGESYYEEDFTTSSQSSSTKVSYAKVMDDVYDNLNWTNLSWKDNENKVSVPVSTGQNEHLLIKLSVDKEQLEDMLSSEDLPYISTILQCSESGIFDASKGVGVGYLETDEEGKSSFKLVFPGRFSRYNDLFSTISYKVISKDFETQCYKSDTIDICLDVNFSNYSGIQQQFNICNFGYGKSTGKYYFMSGTSMSCPMGTGIIASVASNMYDNNTGPSTLEDVTNMLDCVKASVRRNCTDKSLSYLKDKCKTEGIIDLLNAVSASNILKGQGIIAGTSINPIVDSVEYTLNNDNDGTLLIKGNFFNNTDNVFINDHICEIESISSNQIIAKWTNTSKQDALNKCCVSSSDMQRYSNFYFELPGLQTSEYVNLEVSDIKYKDITESTDTITVNDLSPVCACATQNYFYCFFADEENNNIMQRYNFNTGQWFDVDLSQLNLARAEAPYSFQLVAGLNEVYIKYVESSKNENEEEVYEIYLATFSEEENTFINIHNINNYATAGDTLALYKGELLLLDADALGRDEKNDRHCDLIKIYPDTGEIFEEVGNFADLLIDKSGKILPYVSNGRASVFKDKLYIIGSTKTSNPWNASAAGIKSSEVNNGVIIFDGKNFISGSNSIYTSDVFRDPNQTNITGGYAVSNGAIISGMVLNNGKPDMRDTIHWDMNNEEEHWSDEGINKYSNVDDFKVKNLAAACSNNKFYVIAQRGLEQKTFFKYMDLTKHDMYSEDVSSNAKYSTQPQPDPDPQPQPDPTPSNNNVNNDLNNNSYNNTNYEPTNTFDNNSLIIFGLIFVCITAVLIIIYKKKMN